tara:strand:+ start:353 stop:1036 length:684 start_codon:yes stop_codon:yes gene_type:complete
MKKYLLILSASLALFLAPAISYAEVAIGVTMSSNSLDTSGKEDVDSNGTIDATKNVTDDFLIGSLFIENTAMGDRFGITIGLDVIPFDADIDKRSISQSSVKGKDDGAASTGTNSVEGTVENHRTLYLQPGMRFGDDSMIYVTYGFVSADINVKNVSISSTDMNKTTSLDGTKYGVGIKKVSDNGFVLKLDYTDTSYDKVSFKTDNSTTATAELDNTAFALSIGKQF